MVRLPFQKMRQKREEFQQEFRERLSSYMVAALSLVAGLAWNDAVKTAIETFLPGQNSNTIQAKFLYAVVVTIVIVLITIVVVRWAAFDKKDKE